jgi:SAM-dependent methyltransferase
MLKGMLTWLPVLNDWRLRRASTGGSNSPRYCYAVWLRHLVTLNPYGFRIDGARIGELGPGDSIGTGLAALLSGAIQYVGLDIVPFSAKADLEEVFDELTRMYSRREPIPDHHEFPHLRPRLDSYEFPYHLIDWMGFTDRVERIRSELKTGVNSGQLVRYRAPWTSPNDVTVASLDLIFSQAVLEHVDALEETYRTMFMWLKPGGYASHIIDFSAHHQSPFWNGHWAYSDWEWRLVRGRREFLLNREPLSTHLACAKEVGFEVLLSKRNYDGHGLNVHALARRFQVLEAEDVQTRVAMLILRKR